MSDDKKDTTKKRYRVAARFLWDEKTPVTLVDGVAVSLSDTDLVKEIEGTLSRPPEKITVKRANQEQLKKLFEEGHEMIEEYEA